MTNPFGNLNTQGMEAAKDVLGGGFQPLPSGVYSGKVKAAFAGKADSGAQNMTFVLALDVNGQEREYRETIYVTSGTAKGGKNTYEKDGKTYGLPGFITANDLAMMTTGAELNSQNFEEKVQKIWDKDAKQELPQNVLMAVDMLDKPVCVAILETIEPKQVKQGNDYVDDPSGATRSINSIEKVFHPVSGHTVAELTHDMAKYSLSAKDVIAQHKGTFRDDWAAKNDGKPRVKKGAGNAGTAGVPGGKPAQAAPAGGEKKKSLFE